MRPIFHLSVPVRDVAEAVTFYVEELGAEIGRHKENLADVFLFGVQVTLQRDPPSVSVPMPRSRHFGATFDWDDWRKLSARLGSSVPVIMPPTHEHVGEDIEEVRMMIADPSGNIIELKAYRNPAALLGPVVQR